jgi:hypothetical protein
MRSLDLMESLELGDHFAIGFFAIGFSEVDLPETADLKLVNWEIRHLAPMSKVKTGVAVHVTC